MKTCKHCGNPVPQKPGPGRPREFCTKGCRDKAGRQAVALKKVPAAPTQEATV